MTELIAALDVEDPARFEILFHRLRIEAGVRFFKIGARALMMPSWWDNKNAVSYLRHYDVDVFLDLKVYDTKDTVERVAGRAFELGARFLTVHATPSMLETAMRAKPLGDYHKMIAVGALTDGGGYGFLPSGRRADGVICPVDEVKHLRQAHDYKGIIVCPGIRQGQRGDCGLQPAPGNDPHNHAAPATPSEAKAAGADYIVVGRPIIDAPDMVAAARAILAELVD